jgi:hypothetical protein
MEGDSGPGWSFESLTPFSSLGVPRQHSPPPLHDVSRRGSASHRNYYASAGQRARTPDDTAMRVRYSAAREPTLQPNDDSTAAGPVHVRPGAARHPSNHTLPAQNMEYGQVPRFEGDGYDMRRPVGWQTRAEGQGAAEGNRHPVEISDGEDDDPIAIDEEGGDYFEVYNNAVQPGRNGSEDVVDLTEDDDIILTNWRTHLRHGHNDNQAQSQPAHSGRPPADAARLPRGMAGIINLDNGEEQWTVDDEPIILEPSSPEIQFVSARPIDPRNRPPPQPRRSESIGDDVQFVQERPLTEEERRTRQREQQHAELDRVFAVLGNHRGDRRSFAHLRGQIDRANAHIQRLTHNMQQGGPHPPPRGRRADHIRMGVAVTAFVRPTLNFGMVGFDLGYERNQPEPPPATYEAPTAPPEGFTRSPEEEDVLVCPNCDSELCKGDNDIKKQVWIAKQCGHVSFPYHNVCEKEG